MSGPELETIAPRRVVQNYDAIIVVGGGCYGSYYVTQLERARKANAIQYNRVVVVDRDPSCKVSTMDADVDLQIAEWTGFFARYLAESSATSADAIVPSPLMPHLMYQWLLQRAKERWPNREVETRPLPTATELPWETQAPDGTQYASFATWMCPINCVEPKTCPHTKGPRNWTMPVAAAEYVERKQKEGKALDGPIIFHCTHRAYGVGMFDTREVVAGDEFVAAAGERGSADVLVGTVSHCHGAFNVLHLGA